MKFSNNSKYKWKHRSAGHNWLWLRRIHSDDLAIDSKRRVSGADDQKKTVSSLGPYRLFSINNPSVVWKGICSSYMQFVWCVYIDSQWPILLWNTHVQASTSRLQNKLWPPFCDFQSEYERTLIFGHSIGKCDILTNSSYNKCQQIKTLVKQLHRIKAGPQHNNTSR